MMISESLNNFEKSLLQKKEVVADTFDVHNPLYESIVKRASSADIRNCRNATDLTNKYEAVIKESLENEFPDKHWTEVTSCNIKDSLLESHNDIEKVARKIVEGLQIKMRTSTEKRPTGVLAKNMKKRSIAEQKKSKGGKRLVESARNARRKRSLKEYYEDYENVDVLGKAIDDAYADLLANKNEGGCYTFKLYNGLAVCVGWESGYDPKDTPDGDGYNIVAGIKVYTSDSMRTDYEWLNAPYYENGEVWDTTCSLNGSDGKQVAAYLLKEYHEMEDLYITNDGKILDLPSEVTFKKSDFGQDVNFDVAWDQNLASEIDELLDQYGYLTYDFDYNVEGDNVVVTDIKWEVDESLKKSKRGNKLTEARSAKNKSVKEDWYHFSHTSGANPYVAKNEKERDRILKKYKGKAKEIQKGFYEIDDKKKVEPFAVEEESLKEGEEVEYRKKYYSSIKPDGTGESEYWEVEEPAHSKDWHLGGRNKKVLDKGEWQRRQGMKSESLKVKQEKKPAVKKETGALKENMRKKSLKESFDEEEYRKVLSDFKYLAYHHTKGMTKRQEYDLQDAADALEAKDFEKAHRLAYNIFRYVNKGLRKQDYYDLEKICGAIEKFKKQSETNESLKEGEEVEYRKKYYSSIKPDGTGESEYWEVEEPAHSKDWHLGGRNKKVLDKGEWQRRQGMKGESLKEAVEDYDELFAEFLDITEFALEKGKDEDGEDCYHLIDLQGANLGDIESDEFHSAMEIADRMDTYICDYFLDDEEYGEYTSLDDFLDNGPKDVPERPIVDMLANHIDEVDIDRVYDKYFGTKNESLKESDQEKTVIYKSLGKLRSTPKSNYNARIQNARKIHNLDDFNSSDEVIDYYVKNGWAKGKEDFEVIDESSKCRGKACRHFRGKITEAKGSKLSVLLVEPYKAPRQVEIDSGLESLQNAVDGYIEVIYPFDDPVGLICNEEGKINGMDLNRALRDEDGEIYDIVAGPFLVVGLTDEDFCSLSPEYVSKYTQMFKHPEEFFRMGGRIVAYPIDESLKESSNPKPASKNKLKKLDRSLKESKTQWGKKSGLSRRSLKESWDHQLESGIELRNAIQNADDESGYKRIIDALKACYKELSDKKIIDEFEYEDAIDDISLYVGDGTFADWEPDGEPIEDAIDSVLNDFWDLCDSLRVWVPLESFTGNPEDIKKLKFDSASFETKGGTLRHPVSEAALRRRGISLKERYEDVYQENTERVKRVEDFLNNIGYIDPECFKLVRENNWGDVEVEFSDCPDDVDYYDIIRSARENLGCSVEAEVDGKYVTLFFFGGVLDDIPAAIADPYKNWDVQRNESLKEEDERNADLDKGIKDEQETIDLYDKMSKKKVFNGVEKDQIKEIRNDEKDHKRLLKKIKDGKLTGVEEAYDDARNGKSLREARGVDWGQFDQFRDISNQYLPEYGEGFTKASQIVTAVSKIIYRWYNDGDTICRNAKIRNGDNFQSSYANWLVKYANDTDCASILNIARDCTKNQYEQMLLRLAKCLLNPEYLEKMDKEKKQGSVYKCSGPFGYEPDPDYYLPDYYYSESIKGSRKGKKLTESQSKTYYNRDDILSVVRGSTKSRLTRIINTQKQKYGNDMEISVRIESPYKAYLEYGEGGADYTLSRDGRWEHDYGYIKIDNSLANEIISSVCKDAGMSSSYDESLKEDTVKQGDSWVNKGKEGTHGKFKTKKGADAQRKAMFANGYKAEGLKGSRKK